MKKIFGCLFICLNLHAFAGNGKPHYKISDPMPDTSVLSQILVLPLQSYIGKPVDSLFSILPGGHTDRGFMIPKVGHSKGVYQSYNTTVINSCTVEIYIDTFRFMTFPNYTKTSSWDMSLAKKETVAFIKIYKSNGTVCVYGCNNPNYFDN